MKKTKQKNFFLLGILLTIIILSIAFFLVSRNFKNLNHSLRTSLVKEYSGGGECIGFVERYYLNVFNIEIKNVGNAQNLFGIASKFGLYTHKNGSTIYPQPGDILVFGHKNNIGHVSIITDVTKNGLKIVEQNWGGNVIGTNGNRSLPANFNENRYTIENRDDYHVLGWVSRTSHNPSNGSSFLISNSNKNWLPDEGTKLNKSIKKTNNWNVAVTGYKPTVMSPVYLNGANSRGPSEVMIRAKILNNNKISPHSGKIFLRNEKGEWETEIPFQFQNSKNYTKAQKIDLRSLRSDFKITQIRIQLNDRPRVGIEIWSFEWIYIK